jgi:curved DNA-binding protein CbpA
MFSELLVFALDFHRNPLRYRHIANPRAPLPVGFDDLFCDFCVALMPQNIDDTARVLGASPREIRAAALFFVRQVLLARGTDHYRVLGLSPGASEAAVKRHYALVVRLFHPDLSTDSDERDSTFTARINAAYHVLRTPGKRRQYEGRLRDRAGGIQNPMDLRDFSRYREPFPLQSPARGLPFFSNISPRRAGISLTVALVAAGSLFLVFRSGEGPVLRVEQAGETDSAVSAGLLGAQSARDARQIYEPFHAESVRTDSGHPPIGTGKSPPGETSGGYFADTKDTRARTEPNEVLNRLARRYENGDLEGFVELFTVDAETDGGSGIEQIRASYSDIFARTGERRLSFSDMHWWFAGDQEIAGRGRFRLAETLDGRTDRRDKAGTIDFRLVPWRGSYRVSQMIRKAE